MAPSWIQNGAKICVKTGPGSEIGSGTDLGSTLDRFLVDLWPKKSVPEPMFLFWTDFLVDLGTILDGCLVDFWFVFDRCLLHFSDRSAAPGR